MSDPNATGGVTIPPDRIYEILVEVRDRVMGIPAMASTIEDHETRMRRIEKWAASWRPTALLALGSTALNVYQLFHK